MKLLINAIVAIVSVLTLLVVGLALHLFITAWRDQAAAEAADFVLDLTPVSTSEAASTVVAATSVLPNSVAFVCNFGPYSSLESPWFQEDLDLIAQAAEGLEFSYFASRSILAENQGLSVYYNADRVMIGHDWFTAYHLYHREHWDAVFWAAGSNTSQTNLHGCATIANVDVEITTGTHARYIQFLVD